MKAQWLFIIGFGIFIASTTIAVVIVLTTGSGINLSKSSPLNKCQELAYNGIEKTDILFLANKDTSREYMNFFINSRPFLDYKEEFNFYFIDDYDPECELYKGVALLCYSKANVKAAASCPNDHVIVIQPMARDVRSSAYLNFISLNSLHSKTVLLHEFGHTSANLAEEYLTNERPPIGSENCVHSCTAFPEEIDGCFQECSLGGYYRSIENGVMRTLSNGNYGTFNENLIVEKITSSKQTSISGFAIDEGGNQVRDCTQERYYLVEGEYQDLNNINILSKTLEQGCVNENNIGPFSYKISSEDKTIIDEKNFNPEPIFTDLQGKEELTGETYIDEKKFYLTIPEVKNPENLSIENPLGKKIVETSLRDVGARPCQI